jgi:hypothetical protein
MLLAVITADINWLIQVSTSHAVKILSVSPSFSLFYTLKIRAFRGRDGLLGNGIKLGEY